MLDKSALPQPQKLVVRAAMPHTNSCWRAASALHSSMFVPFVPCMRLRPATHLLSLREWTPALSRQHSGRCYSALTEPATAASIADFIQVRRDRQPKRFSPDLCDAKGRLMLKNLTKAELLEWLELQGMFVDVKPSSLC